MREVRDGRGVGADWRTVGLLLLLHVLQLPLYGALNSGARGARRLESGIDPWIPLVPAFVLPYLSFFGLIAVTSLGLLRHRDPLRCARFLLALILTTGVSYVVYALWQTVVLRPDLSGDRGWAPQLLMWVYRSDSPYNAFPSLHTSISVVCALFLVGSPGWRRTGAIWAALVVASTLLVKQHYLADAVSGALLGWAATRLAGRLLVN